MADYKETQPIVVEPDDLVIEPYKNPKINEYANAPEWQNNHKIITKLQNILSITTDDVLKEAFTSLGDTLARPFAMTMEENSKELIATQATLRQCVQSVRKVLSYKPTVLDEQQKKRWELIHDFSTKIRDSIINAMEVTAEWFGFLLRLFHGLAYFYETMDKTPSIALVKFQSAANDFATFQKMNSAAYMLVREQSQEAMAKIESTFSGGQGISDARAKQDEFRKRYINALKKLSTLEANKLNKIRQIKIEIAKLKGEIAQYNVQLKYANKDITNLEREQKEAHENAYKKEIKAQSAKNYKKVRKTVNVFGWKLWSFDSNVETGDKDTMNNIAATFGKKRDSAKNSKHAQVEIQKLATKLKTEAQQKVYVYEATYEQKIGIHDKLIENQTAVAKKAGEDWENAVQTIQNAVKMCAVGEHSITEFYSSASQFGEQSLKALEQTKRIEVVVRTLSDILNTTCEDELTVATHFKKNWLPSALIEAFQKKGYNFMEDIVCDDEKEFDQTFGEILDSAEAEPGARNRIRRMCTDQNKISKWQTQDLSTNSARLLKGQIPALYLFFPTLFYRLKFSCTMLSLRAKAGHASVLQAIVKGTKQLKANDESNMAVFHKQTRAITLPNANIYINNTENKPHISKAYDEKEPVMKTQIMLLETLMDGDTVKCIDGDHGRVYISVDEHKYQELHALLEKGKQRRVDVELSVSSINTGQRINSSIISAALAIDLSDCEIVLILQSLLDTETAKCVDENGVKHFIEFNTDKWYEPLQQSLAQTHGSDVRLKVRVKNTGNRNEYTIMGVIDENKAENVKIVTLQKLLDKETAKCIDKDSVRIFVEFNEDRWYEELERLLKETENSGDVKLQLEVKNRSDRIEYTIKDAYK